MTGSREGAAPDMRIDGVVAVADADRLIVHVDDVDHAADLTAFGQSKPVALHVRGVGRFESRLLTTNDRWATFERPPALNVSDARHARRTPVEMLPALVELANDSFAAYVLDVAPRGLRLMIEHDTRLRTGAQLHLTIERRRCRVEVRHAKRVGTTLLMHVGVRILTADEGLRSLVLRLSESERTRRA